MSSKPATEIFFQGPLSNADAKTRAAVLELCNSLGADHFARPVEPVPEELTMDARSRVNNLLG